jgi:hypothetical protein
MIEESAWFRPEETSNAEVIQKSDHTINSALPTARRLAMLVNASEFPALPRTLVPWPLHHLFARLQRMQGRVALCNRWRHITLQHQP